MNDSDVATAATLHMPQLSELKTFIKIRLDQYKEFSEIMKIKYNNNENDINNNEEYELESIVFLGLGQWKKNEMGYEIIHNGKIADQRILQNYSKITQEFIKIHTYPKIPATVLQIILNKVLGNMGNRSKKHYRKTILYYCNFDEDVIDKCSDSRLGELDVSGFVRRVPRNI